MPSTVIEDVMVEIWGEVLGLQHVNLDDNFFDLGGHSLLAMQILSRVTEIYGFTLPIRTIFESPTVADLADVLDQSRRKSLGMDLSPVQAVSRRHGLPVSIKHERRLMRNGSWQAGRDLIGGAFYLTGDVNREAIDKSLGYLVYRHEPLRTTFYLDESGSPSQNISDQIAEDFLSTISLRYLSSSAQDAELLRLSQQESTRPIDLSRGPLINATLVELGTNRVALLLFLDHIICDGWSLRLLFDELSTVYNTYIRGEEPNLDPPPVQYADVACWQRVWLLGSVLDVNVNYWRSQLAPHLSQDVLPGGMAKLPTDYPRESMTSARGEEITSLLAEGWSAELTSFSRRERVTRFLILLTAFHAALFRFYKQSLVSTLSPFANRPLAAIHNTIGDFNNILPICSTPSHDQTLLSLLYGMRRAVLEADAHQVVPVNLLWEGVDSNGIAKPDPTIRGIFFSVDTPAALTMDRIDVNPVKFKRDKSMFDISLIISNEDDKLSARLLYRAELFSRQTAKCLFAEFFNCLGQLLVDPETRLGDSFGSYHFDGIDS